MLNEAIVIFTLIFAIMLCVGALWMLLEWLPAVLQRRAMRRRNRSMRAVLDSATVTSVRIPHR